MQAAVLGGSNGQHLQLSPFPLHSSPIFSGIVSIVEGVPGTTGEPDHLLPHNTVVWIQHAAIEIHIGIGQEQYKGRKKNTYKCLCFMQPDVKREMEKIKKSYIWDFSSLDQKYQGARVSVTFIEKCVHLLPPPSLGGNNSIGFLQLM